MTYHWWKKCHCGCSVGVIHRVIPHSEACPLSRGAHGGDSLYPWLEGVGGVLELCLGWPAGGGVGQYPPEGGGGQYQAGGSGGGHVGGCPAVGDPPHGITGGGPVCELYNMKI
jgi:hypothetical protein